MKYSLRFKHFPQACYLVSRINEQMQCLLSATYQGEEMKGLEFKCQGPAVQSPFRVSSNELGQRMWRVVSAESTGLIKGRRRQLTIFIPLGPGEPANKQAVVCLPALSIQGHCLMGKNSHWVSGLNLAKNGLKQRRKDRDPTG